MTSQGERLSSQTRNDDDEDEEDAEQREAESRGGEWLDEAQQR